MTYKDYDNLARRMKRMSLIQRIRFYYLPGIGLFVLAMLAMYATCR